jgi:hypothetical protein
MHAGGASCSGATAGRTDAEWRGACSMRTAIRSCMASRSSRDPRVRPGVRV